MRVVCLSIALALSATIVPVSAQAIAKRYELNIPHETLDAALKDFARQTGLQLARFSDTMDGSAMVGPVSGGWSAGEALERLLSSQGLSYKVVNDRTIAIVNPRDVPAAVPEAATNDSSPAQSAGKEPQKQSFWERFRVAQLDSQASGADGALTQPGASASAQSASQIEEIVVTANKRIERLVDVPAAVTAVRADNLAQTGLLRITDYEALVPGLNVNDATAGGGQNAISIRGITTGPTGNPTVGIFIDDAPLGSSVGLGGGSSVPDIDPSDLERIEVLRGPQGTLYGGGSIGGLIKFVTKSPDFDSFSGRVEVDGTSVAHGGEGLNARGSVNVPLSDDLAIRASAFSRNDPGYIENLTTAQENSNRRLFDGGRLSLGARLGENFRLRLSAATQRIRARATTVVDVDGATGQPLYGDLQTRRAPGSDNSRYRDSIFDLRITGDVGWAELVSSSAYQDRDSTSNFDYSPVLGPVISGVFGIPSVGAAVFGALRNEKFTQEVRFSSQAERALGWQVGAFYTHEKSGVDQDVNAFDLTTGGPLPTTLPLLYAFRTPSTFEEVAAFGNVTYHFTSRFDTTFGARYSRNEQSGAQNSDGVFAGTSSLPLESDGTAFTWLVNPRFKITDDAMFYARLASGYQPGGPNLPAPNVPASFDAATVLNYEAGIKMDLLAKSLTLDAAVYYIDWDDIQVRQISSINTTYYINGSKAHSQGVEATASWHPVSGLTFAGNVSYNESKLDQALTGGAANKGDRLPDTPRWAGLLSGEYRFPVLSGWDASFGTSWRYVGERSGSLATTPYLLPAYRTWDVRAGLENERYSVHLFARNLGDERGYVSAFPFGAIQQVALIQPRTLGISVAATFE